MADYTPINSGELVADQPITESLLTRLRDNPIAMFERDAGAPTWGATVDSAGNNANGYYRIWSDGFIEQWGVHQAGSNGYLDHTLPISYTDINSMIIISKNLSLSSDTHGTGEQSALRITDVSVSRFGLTVTALRWVHWYTKGY